MISYIWPKDQPSTRNRVKLAVGLLVAAKLLNISVPFIFKHAVDYLNQGRRAMPIWVPRIMYLFAFSAKALQW